MLTMGFFCIFFYGILVFLSPFPYLRTYILLWKEVLQAKEPAIGGSVRLRQALYLLIQGVSIPLWTLLWYADEMLFPGYRRQNVEPLFLIGQPRSGTTLLHRTIAEDHQHFYAVRHFEWRYPFICVQLLVRWLGLERMIERTSYWPNTEAGRLAARMHPNMLCDYEEDGIFYEERLMHHLFVFLRFPYPELLHVLDSFPELPSAAQHRMLKVHHKVIQKVSYLHGGGSRYYLSKEVTSHNRIPRLLDLYPKSRFVILVRPSCELIDSLLALVRNSTLAKTGVDPLRIAGWREAFLDRMRADCQRLVDTSRNEIGQEKQVCLTFRAVTEDLESSVMRVYDFIGLVPTDTFRDQLSRLTAQQSNRDRGYDYKHEAISGFTTYDAFVRDLEYSVTKGHDEPSERHFLMDSSHAPSPVSSPG